ncbi:MAG: hypothetical protein AAGE52_01175 [Myxococcota bacterium]
MADGTTKIFGGKVDVTVSVEARDDWTERRQDEWHRRLAQDISTFIEMQDSFWELVRRIEREPEDDRLGITVILKGQLNHLEAQMHGGFLPPQHDNDHWLRIEIFRRFADVPQDPWRELHTLAHEIGHARGYLSEKPPRMYYEAVDKSDWKATLSPEEKRAIMSEETRAWVNAIAELKAIGRFNKTMFVKIAHQDLGIYAERLDIDQGVFEDEWQRVVDAVDAAA